MIFSHTSAARAAVKEGTTDTTDSHKQAQLSDEFVAVSLSARPRLCNCIVSMPLFGTQTRVHPVGFFFVTAIHTTSQNED